MAKKIEIPESLKAALPQNIWGKILAATPVVMTVIATMLAGLASSEMTKAQYDRAFAAQLQSKAGDQWSYYQAKKLRGAEARNLLDLLAATTEIHPPDTTVLANVDAATIAAFTKGEIPKSLPAKFSDNVQTALDSVAGSAPEEQITTNLTKIKIRDLDDALAAAKSAADDFDKATKSINQTSDKLENTLIGGDPKTFRDFTAARLRYTAARYDAESKLNSTVAQIYELQVRQNNLSAEKHHRRSQKFFYGMLAAQMAVIIATFAIAAQKRNFLWSLAAAAGLAAVSFSVYVYLRV